MALSNNQRIRKGLDTLKSALIPFVERHLAAWHDDWQRLVSDEVRLRYAEDGSIDWDVSALMVTMTKFWGAAFREVLSHDERNYVGLIRSVRNDWGHEKTFTSEEVLRALDHMQMLLQAANAHDAATELGKQKQDLQRVVFQEEARNRRRYSPTFEGMASPNLKPWRELVMPHRDVATGNYMQAEFAADLAQVHKGEGSDEYRDPVEFFKRTYVTEGMKDLLDGALKRLDGKDGDPVVELQTNFGGGKTHSMLALYHLFSGADATSLQGVERVLADTDVTRPAKANRAVLVGTALSPGEVDTKHDGTQVRTMWGEMAWQLGGADGYALVAESDAKGVSPGSSVLAELMRRTAPCLILIDEWVAYARQIYGHSGLPAGTFDAQTSFAQALTEAAAQVPKALVVASIPASKIEIGGEAGEHALEVLKNVFERVGKPWRPAGGDEGFEIVRRRLFEPIEGKEAYATRDAVIEEFAKMYSQNEGDFPLDCREGDYREKMRGSYPIHPELFRRLYDDWSTLDKFQRTRGVLRLLAKVIHRLWEDEDKALMILPASVPMDDGAVKSELTRYLSDPWEPIISRDVDGPDSIPLDLDRQTPTLGKYGAARRVARTLYIGTAPGSDQSTPGVGSERILLGCAQPGDSLGAFRDALRRISDQGQNIHQDGNRYWISTRSNLNRTAAAKASQLLREPEELYPEIIRRLQADRSRGQFAGVHVCPESSLEVPDEPKARLVIFGPKLTHKRGNGSSPARVAADEYLESRGNGPRSNRNALVFLAPDEKELKSLLDATAHYLAWKSIHDGWEAMNLDAFQKNQASTKEAEFDRAIDLRIGNTWIHGLSPTKPSPTDPTAWDEVKCSGSDPLAVRLADKLVRDELLLPQMGGIRLRMELDRYLWKEQDHVSFGELTDWFPKYLYLPRVTDHRVLEQAVRDGAGLLNPDDAFAVAGSCVAETGSYLGLRVGSAPEAVTSEMLLVKPSVAAAQQATQADQASASQESAAQEGFMGSDSPGASYSRASAHEQAQPTAARFVGSVPLKSLRTAKQVGQIVEEVLSHLTGLPRADASLTLEVQINLPEGVDTDVKRTVTENARQLGFDHASFE